MVGREGLKGPLSSLGGGGKAMESCINRAKELLPLFSDWGPKGVRAEKNNREKVRFGLFFGGCVVCGRLNDYLRELSEKEHWGTFKVAELVYEKGERKRQDRRSRAQTNKGTCAMA